MKKTFLYALGMMAMLCSCNSGSVVENGNGMTATGFVAGLGNATSSVAYYDLREENPGCKVDGFSHVEPFGRWSSSEFCYFVFDNITPNSELTAKINVAMAIPTGAAAQYDVFANDQYVSSGEAYQGVLYINIPSSKVGDSDTLALGFKIKNTFRPIDLDPNIYDSRQLGMALTDVTLYGYSLDAPISEDDEKEDEE